VGHSICLLTAALMTAQSGPTVCSSCQNNVTAGGIVVTSGGDGPGFFERMQKVQLIPAVDPTKPSILEKMRDRWQRFTSRLGGRGDENTVVEGRRTGLFGPRRGETTVVEGEPIMSTQVVGAPVMGVQMMNAPYVNATVEPPLVDTVPQQVPATFGSPTISVSPIAYQQPQAEPGRPLSPVFESQVGCGPNYEFITGQIFFEKGRWTICYATPNTVDAYHGRLVLATTLDMSRFQDGDLVSVRGHVIDDGLYQVVSIHLLARLVQ
jgi:hypothetical protein